MELKVRNVGKVDSAEIEINGVTVITGYNSTGKSTICKSLYAIMDTFADIGLKVQHERRKSILTAVYQWQDKLLSEEIEEDICDEIYGALTHYFVMTKNVEAETELREKIAEICSELQVIISDKTLDTLLEKYREIIRKDKEEYLQFIISQNVKNIFRNQIGHVNYNKKKVEMELLDGKKLWKIVFDENDLSEYSCKYIALKKPIYIEPQSVLDNFNGYGVFPKRVKMDSVTDFLLSEEREHDNITLEEYQEREENIKIIKQILQDVTKGQLVSGQNSRLTYSERGLKENIVCGNVASGLKPFLIIQRMIEDGTLGAGRMLIIDEPEVNLHPEWQLVFAEILVLLHKKLDIKVVLSTHSPYFLRAIEYYMNEYENTMNGKYYLTVETEEQLYTVKDVTDEKELIYKALYKPLEEIN